MKCQIFAYFCLVLHKQKLVKQNLWSNEKTKRNKQYCLLKEKRHKCAGVYIYTLYIYMYGHTHRQERAHTHTQNTCITRRRFSTTLASKPSSRTDSGLLARLKILTYIPERAHQNPFNNTSTRPSQLKPPQR